ncbi:MAG: hypothetical protein WCR52_11935 [Bacteroidota bacterium]
MSINTKLVVFNASSQAMQNITTIVSHNSDWGNNKPSDNFNNVTIGPFAYRSMEEDIDSDADSANFQMTITYANGDQIVITSNQLKALQNGASQFSPTGTSAENYRSYIIAGSNDLFFAVFPNVNSQTWMKSTWDSLSGKQLCQIALPGSHDAGMYKINYSTALSTTDNTRTQSMKIGDQLNNGSRFFELRPMIWKDETDSSDMYLGHFAPPGSSIGLQGSLGEKLSDVLNDIKSFIINPNNDHEIVVLRFEQYRDIDNDGADFSDNQKSDLRKLVLKHLGPYLYTSSDPNCNLGYVNVQDMYDANTRIIAVFDDFSGHLDCTTGIFSYGANDSTKSYRLLDDYANTDIFNDMLSDQTNKFNDFTSSDASMFLLSWTLTMKSTDFVSTSIENLATVANSNLWYGIFEMFKNEAFLTYKIPNIIYVDFVDSKYYLAEAAYCLNSFATGYY